MSIVTKNLSLLGMSVISMMSAISSLLLAENLFSPYAFCCGEIKLKKIFLSLDAEVLKIIL